MMISQFPFENIITNKELLSLIARRSRNIQYQSSEFGSDGDEQDPYVKAQNNPPWLCTTFNLSYELPQFAVYYQYREDKQLDNHWIIKPTNLTRGIDMNISNQFDMIIRLPESGPKIACKYIDKPLLISLPESIGGPVKFDVRYVLLLRQLKPLKLYVHKIFWLRFANKPFDLTETDDYEKHFTVMNYRSTSNLRQMDCIEFIELFEKQYPDQQWSIIEQRIFEMLREVFEYATLEEPPLGIGAYAKSRALYATDIMLEYNKTQSGKQYVQPKLLEINFTPDVNRACKYYPHFYDQVFNVLFRDVTEDQDVIDISSSSVRE